MRRSATSGLRSMIASDQLDVGLAGLAQLGRGKVGADQPPTDDSDEAAQEQRQGAVPRALGHDDVEAAGDLGVAGRLSIDVGLQPFDALVVEARGRQPGAERLEHGPRRWSSSAVTPMKSR